MSALSDFFHSDGSFFFTRSLFPATGFTIGHTHAYSACSAHHIRTRMLSLRKDLGCWSSMATHGHPSESHICRSTLRERLDRRSPWNPSKTSTSSMCWSPPPVKPVKTLKSLSNLVGCFKIQNFCTVLLVLPDAALCNNYF